MTLGGCPLSIFCSRGTPPSLTRTELDTPEGLDAFDASPGSSSAETPKMKEKKYTNERIGGAYSERVAAREKRYGADRKKLAPPAERVVESG